MPTGDAAQQSEAEGGEARPSCGLTASINYFFAPYYRKLSGECLPTGPFPGLRVCSRVTAASTSAAYRLRRLANLCARAAVRLLAQHDRCAERNPP